MLSWLLISCKHHNFVEWDEKNELSHFKLGLSASTMELVLDYIYSGQAFMDRDNVEGLIKGADMMQLDGLKDFCSSFIEKQVFFRNIF